MSELNNSQPDQSVAVEANHIKNIQIKPKTLKEWLSADEFKNAIASALPSHMSSERFVRIALTATMRIPKLAQCTQSSIFKCLLDLSSLGLEPDGRRAHLIPYENRKTGVTECQLIIDYKGLIELAKRSGEVKSWRSELVCENDIFSWDNGIITHKVDWLSPRGKTKAVYSHVKNKNDVDDYEIMTLDEVESIRKRSKAGQSGPWVTDFNEMAKKTVMRRHSKRLTLSPEFSDALEKDADRLEDVDQTISIEEIMPKEVENSTEHKKQYKISDITPDNEKYVDYKISDCPITNAGMEKILIALRDKGLTKDKLTKHIIATYSKKTLSELLESNVEPICQWIEQSTID